MRTRLTILLALTVALAIGASALMTSQLGIHEWPTAPAPDTATRLITPSEAVGRVTDRAAGDRDEPAERAQRDAADRAPAVDEAPAATTPVDTVSRRPRRAAAPATTEEPVETPDSETAEAPDQPSTPPTTPVPATPATPVEDQHTRDDDVVTATPEIPLEDDPRRGRPSDLLDPLP